MVKTKFKFLTQRRQEQTAKNVMMPAISMIQAEGVKSKRHGKSSAIRPIEAVS